MREVQCPRCGKVFICKHDGTCFCTKYVLSEEAKKNIRSRWSECLCEDCLKYFAEPKSIEPKSESCS